MATSDRHRASAYTEHLTRADLQWLARHARRPGEAQVDATDRLRADAGALEAVLGEPATERSLLGGEGEGLEALAAASPFLLFAVVVHRVHRTLGDARHLQEWVGPRQRVPVFSAGQVREFLDDGWARLFLAELLASYTKVASGVVWRAGRGGSRRRQRISDLDPRRLAGLLHLLPEEAHAGVYRRLGDVSLFLTGVFPDYTATRLYRGTDVQRLAAVASGPDGEAGAPAARGGDGESLADALSARGTVGMFEHLGARWYRCAEQCLGDELSGTIRALPTMAERFGDARRTLNVVADRYLFPKSGWSPLPFGG